MIQAGIIGGMYYSGFWKYISSDFEKKFGIEINVITKGARPLIDKSFRNGELDFATMHSGDITTNIIADGFGRNLRPWVKNELVLVGSKSDPANIQGLSIEAAIHKIVETDSKWIYHNGIGPTEIIHNLKKKEQI